jgi:peptide deformylase
VVVQTREPGPPRDRRAGALGPGRLLARRGRRCAPPLRFPPARRDPADRDAAGACATTRSGLRRPAARATSCSGRCPVDGEGRPTSSRADDRDATLGGAPAAARGWSRPGVPSASTSTRSTRAVTAPRTLPRADAVPARRRGERGGDLEIRIFGDPVLRQRATRSRTSTVGSPRSPTTCSRRCGRRGVGLAANQVGVLKRLFTWEVELEEEERGTGPSAGRWSTRSCSTPPRSSRRATRAACPSPACSTRVERPLRVEVAHQDLGGDEHTVQLEGFLARVWLHEMDHLNGILFIDHLAAHDRKAALKRCASTASSRGSTTPTRPRRAAARRAAARPAAGGRREPRAHRLPRHPRGRRPALEALVAADDVEVVGVVTNPDRPGPLGTPVPPPVKVAAEATASGLAAGASPRGARRPRGAGVDACAVVAYGALLPRDVLDAGGRGFVNLHFSLLPRWRGAAPVQHACAPATRVTGVTTFVLDEGMDTGPVLRRVEVPIGPDETAGHAARAAGRGRRAGAGRRLRPARRRREPGAAAGRGRHLAPKITPTTSRSTGPPGRRSPTWCAAPTRRPARTRRSAASG